LVIFAYYLRVKKLITSVGSNCRNVGHPAGQVHIFATIVAYTRSAVLRIKGTYPEPGIYVLALTSLELLSPVKSIAPNDKKTG
jgi:hypothetical protein